MSVAVVGAVPGGTEGGSWEDAGGPQGGGNPSPTPAGTGRGRDKTASDITIDTV